MKTEYTSKQNKVTAQNLQSYFGNQKQVEFFNLWDITITKKGHGHYVIKTIININNEEITIKSITNDMQLIDVWKSGINEMYEEGENDCYYEKWDEVVDSMLFASKIEDKLNEYMNDV
jgi:hypothetical protein